MIFKIYIERNANMEILIMRAEILYLLVGPEPYPSHTKTLPNTYIGPTLDNDAYIDVKV